MERIIEIKNLKKNFNKTEALKDVTFNITKGDVVGFIGPNGAGKTTTIRIILGLIKKTDGNIKVFNKDPWKDSTIIHSDISYVPGDI
ncbi:MAG TPA: ATP-binding cassette domain-containing protein, partial [Mollicutes bacterium]|nr:ATP-binding cassette domain-containing protein [Mollicutes bacterium]